MQPRESTQAVSVGGAKFATMLLCLGAFLLSACVSAAPLRELASHVLDDFATLDAWSTHRNAERIATEYSQWEMARDADGPNGSCLRLRFALRAPSADIWGDLHIEEPVDALSLGVQNVTRHAARLTLALVEEDGSNYVSAPVDLDPDGGWHRVSFPVKALTAAPWQPDENGRLDFPTAYVVLVVTGVEPGLPTTLRLAHLTTESPRPARVRLADLAVPPTVAAGQSLTVSASLLALEEVSAAPTTLQLVREGAVVASAAAPAPGAVLRAGATATVGPLRIRVPAMSWGGPYQLVLRRPGAQIVGHEDGRLATVSVMPRVPRPVKYSVQSRNGTPQLFANEAAIPTASYMYERSDPEEVKRFARAGVHLYWLECRQMGWVGPERYDYALIDELLADLFRCDPEARVVLWFYVDLSSPLVDAKGDWWQATHPEELCRDAGGKGWDNYGHQAVSLASDKWRHDATGAMTHFVKRMEGSPFTDRIVGYQPCAGISYEWMYYGGHSNVFLDYSAPTVRAFREWLRSQYGGQEARLRAAWGSDTVTFATAVIPSPAQREHTTLGCLRDPQSERPVVDYYTFLAELTGGTIDYFCRAIKRATGGAKITGAFYGYVMEQAFVHGGAQHTGHFALGRVLASDDIDFLMSPTSYGARGPGEPGAYMSALGSVRLHGKLWLNQADLRTYLSPADAGFGRSANVGQSLGVMRREFAMDLAAGVPVYWYSFSAPWFGPSDTLMEGVREMAQIASEADGLSRGLDGDGLAVIVSDSIAAHTGLSQQPLRSLVYLQRGALHRSGIRFDVFLDSDLDNPKLPRYKAYLFLDAVHLTAAQRRWIDANLKRDGRVLAFAWAQGISGDSLALSNAAALSGIHLGLDATPGLITVQPDPGLGPAYGATEPFAPVLFADDPDARTFGRLTSPQGVAGKVGLCTRQYPGWTSVYSAAPTLSPEVIRMIARLAGIHVWSESNDPIYVGPHFLGIHAPTAGKRSLSLPTPATVVDCFSGREVGRGVTRFDVDLGAAETAIYRIK
jgi:hypothetical protein